MPLNYDRLPGYQTNLPRNGCSCRPGIAGNHDDFDACSVAILKSLRHFRAWRIKEPHESGKGETIFRNITCRSFSQLLKGESDHPQPFGSHGLLLLQKFSIGSGVKWNALRAATAKRCAERHDTFTRPFDQSKQLPIDFMKGRHALSVGIERSFAQPFTAGGIFFGRIFV